MYAESLAGMKPGFEIAQFITVNITDDVDAGLNPVKAMLGFYIGGMGAKKRNFHKELMGRMGFADEAEKIQELFMAGDRWGAVAAVPSQFADEISLVGPIERIKERLAEWKKTPVTALLLAQSRRRDAAHHGGAVLVRFSTREARRRGARRGCSLLGASRVSRVEGLRWKRSSIWCGSATATRSRRFAIASSATSGSSCSPTARCR